MALLLPVLLLLVMGVATIGHAMTVRFMLSSAAYDAARTCTLQGTPTSICARTMMKRKLGKSMNWCNTLQVNIKKTKEPGYTAVMSFEVSSACAYKGPMASKFLAQNKLHVITLRARASMPY